MRDWKQARLYKSLIAAVMFTALLLGQPIAGQAASGFDEVSYLAAKYESLGDPGTAGTGMNYGNDRGNACGKYQFDQRYELGPFVTWCYGKDPDMYAPFAPYVGVPNNGRNHPILKTQGFWQAWRQVYGQNPEVFEADQDAYVEANVLNPALARLTRHYGYDFNNASNALKGCVLSFANRDGAYVESLHRYFDGTGPSSTEEEIIHRAYGRMMGRRPREVRWRLEFQDCLAMRNGTMDIYAASENAAGGINWGHKRELTAAEVATVGVAAGQGM